MKLISFLLICVGICNAAENLCTGDNFKSVLEKCALANGGDMLMIEKLLFLKKPSNENEKCFYACELRECNLMDESGNLVLETYRKYTKLLSRNESIREQRLAKAYEKCLKITKIDENQCTTAANYFDCLNTNCEDCGWDLSVLLGVNQIL